MKKIIDFIKKHYLIFTIMIVIILMLIALIIIFNIIYKKNKIIVKNENINLYQYYGNNKQLFTTKVSYENNKIVSIDNNIYENSLIYYENNLHLIIPKTSMIVFYYQDNLTYRLNKYSEYLKDNGSNIIISEGSKIISNDFFIYDGDDLYILPDASILNINNNVINLTSGSYIIANQDNVIYYDYENDSIMTIDNIEKAQLNLKNITIDLLKDVTVYNNKVLLLDINSNNTEVYKES